MINKTIKLSKKLNSCRDAFGKALIEAGEKDQNVVVLTADLEESTRVHYFKNRFPERFFDVGVSEQALAAIASGLANYGKTPVITSFATFSPGRNWEQIRTTICINKVPVKIVSTHAGINVGEDGATHQALEDIALMRVLPNMVVISPSDAEETRKAICAALKTKTPVYIRLPRYETKMYTTPRTPFEIGKAVCLWQGKDPKVAIMAAGPSAVKALKAAQTLSKNGIESLVLNNHTIKPIDQEAIVNAAKLTGCVVTIEDHQIKGGFGSAVAETLSELFPVPIEFIGINDSFGESGKPKELLTKFGLTAENIVEKALKAIKRKMI